MTDAPVNRPRVVLTRAAVDNQALADRLDAIGIDTVNVPMIEVQPPADGGNALEAAVAGLDHYHWLIVTSVNGVQAVAETIEEVGLGWPDHLRVAVVGPSTAKAAKSFGWPVDFVPSQATAENLVDEFPPSADDGPPIRVLAALAELAGPVIKKGLGKQGFQVDHVIAYRTAAPPRLDDPSQEAAVAGGVEQADAIAFTSSSTINRFVARFGHDAVPSIVVCIGPRSSMRARQLGITVTAVASPYTEDGLVNTLARVLARP